MVLASFLVENTLKATNVTAAPCCLWGYMAFYLIGRAICVVTAFSVWPFFFKKGQQIKVSLYKEVR